MQIKLTSLGLKHRDFPETAHMKIKVLELPNPHSIWGLRDQIGTSEEVKNFLRESPKFKIIVKTIVEAAQAASEDIHIAVACYGGKHRSVAVVDEAAYWLRMKGVPNVVEHLELEGHPSI